MQRAGAGDCVDVTREREGQSPEEERGQQELQVALFQLVAVVN